MNKYFKKFSIMLLMLLSIIGFGTIQNVTVVNAATVGQQLTQPEGGWRRVENTDSNINYIGKNWGLYYYGTESDGNTSCVMNPNGVSVKFNFTGNKIRIINPYNPLHGELIEVYIDGIKVNTHSLAFSDHRQVIAYENNNLSNAEHCFEYKFIGNGEAVFDAVDIDSNGQLKPYSELATTSSSVILNIEPEKTQIHLKETVTANLTIDNIKEIAAEDVRIKYDNTKLKFLSMDELEGIKLVKSEDKDGELRLILASKGITNVVNAKKALLKLNFQGIASGDALVDVTKGKVSDGITMEKDLTDAECGQATIKIDDVIMKDVNNSGEFTLLDLAIDGRHFSEDPKTLTQYNTDTVVNNAIDNDDLTKIGEYMLANPTYKFS